MRQCRHEPLHPQGPWHLRWYPPVLVTVAALQVVAHLFIRGFGSQQFRERWRRLPVETCPQRCKFLLSGHHRGKRFPVYYYAVCVVGTAKDTSLVEHGHGKQPSLQYSDGVTSSF